MSPQKKVGLFLFLTFLLSLTSYLPIIHSGNPNTQGGIFVLTLMWSPGVAAILTQLITTRSLRGLGWRLGTARWLGIAYILPVVYALPVYVFTWLTGWGAFRNPYDVSSLTRQYASPNLASAITVYLLLNATVAWLVPNLLMAVGEEIGWRGLLAPELAKMTSFTKTALISGIIWAAWHMPLIFLSSYHGDGTPVVYSAACFTLLLIAISFPLAWLRLKSGSLWTAAFLHASHNLFLAAFGQLTGETGITAYIIGEFGIGLALTSLVAAYVIWRRQRGVSPQSQLFASQPVAHLEPASARQTT